MRCRSRAKDTPSPQGGRAFVVEGGEGSRLRTGPALTLGVQAKHAPSPSACDLGAEESAFGLGDANERSAPGSPGEANEIPVSGDLEPHCSARMRGEKDVGGKVTDPAAYEDVRCAAFVDTQADLGVEVLLSSKVKPASSPD